MNERIKELSGKALDIAIPETYTEINLRQFQKFRDTFAELIVKECCAQVERQYKYATKQTSTWSMSQDVQDMLKKHFGVEE